MLHTTEGKGVSSLSLEQSNFSGWVSKRKCWRLNHLGWKNGVSNKQEGESAPCARRPDWLPFYPALPNTFPEQDEKKLFKHFVFFYFTLCDFIYKMRLNSYLMRFWKHKMRCYCKILHWCPLLVKALIIDKKVVSSLSCSCSLYLFIPFLLILLLLHLPVTPLPPVPPLYSSSSSPSSFSSCSSACLCSVLSPSPFHFLLHPFVSYLSLEFEKESL